MAYQPISFRGFGRGLNLRDKVDAVSEEECIDALNVVFTERGAVKQRTGYDNFGAALTNSVASLHAHYRAGTTPQLLAGCGTRLEALDNAGAVVASDAGLTTGTWDFVRFGTPNAEVSYAGQGDTTLRSWDGSAWANVANTPKAGALAVMAVSNRIVAGRFNVTTGGPTGGASTSSPSHVYFSDAGSATAWTATNFLQFTPGDGEKVQAVIAWREFVFVFKETKFFVIYGESQDAAGDPVFEYRTVDTGVGLASPRAVAADDTGVYFLHRRGVYRTTGGEPELLSSNIDPIFLGGASDFYLGGTLDHADITTSALTCHDGRIYLSFTTDSTNNRTLVYDTGGEWWSLWDLAASCHVSFKLSGQPELFFGYAAGTKNVGRHNSSYTSDDGTAITSRWRSGWQDFGVSDTKTSRERKAWGSGRVSTAVSTDFQVTPGDVAQLDFSDPTASVWESGFWEIGSWSTGAGLISDLDRRAKRGTVFSTYFYNATLNQDWGVHRLDHHLREARVPSMKAA